jgi:hypothetical protein
MAGNVTIETKVHHLPKLNYATDTVIRFCKESTRISSFQNSSYVVKLPP